MKAITVVGTSLAGLQAARALRAQGYDGRLDMVGNEVHRPYDRPPLSKDFLAGKVGIHVLRTVDDAIALRAELRPGARLVVIGAGFMGAEVASTARALGCEVTIVEARQTPLADLLGTRMGSLVAGLHRQHGVRLLCGVGVAEIVVRGRVEAVRLADRSEYPADVVVVSVGDCASWYDVSRGRSQRVEHWTAALERPATAVTSLLRGSAGGAPTPIAVPYLWTDQYGVRIQFAGHAMDADSVDIEEGSIRKRNIIAVYRRAGDPVAVLAMNQASQFGRWRSLLNAVPVPGVGPRD